MKSKEVDVIRLMLENKEKELSINQVAKLLKKDYKNAHNIVRRLETMRLIELRPLGRSHRVLMHNKINPLLFEAEHQRRTDLLKNKNIAVLHDSFRELHSTLYVLLVFGSYANKTQTKHSDIDLLFTVSDESEERMEREIQGIARTIPLKLHINIFKESDFRAMKHSKKITVGTEAIRNNVILHGIEAYYELIQDSI